MEISIQTIINPNSEFPALCAIGINSNPEIIYDSGKYIA